MIINNNDDNDNNNNTECRTYNCLYIKLGDN